MNYYYQLIETCIVISHSVWDHRTPIVTWIRSFPSWNPFEKPLGVRYDNSTGKITTTGHTPRIDNLKSIYELKFV